MITTPTVLVLGAGASYPYGFPTGVDLKRLICEQFSTTRAVASQLLGCLNPEGTKFAPDEFSKFREAFLKSGQPSVDAFLERRPEFLDVGKLAIAFCLMPFEKEENLYYPDPSRGGDWYEYLSVKLNSSFEEFGQNKLSIITFNYDRSLEQYLLNSLINLHGKMRRGAGADSDRPRLWPARRAPVSSTGLSNVSSGSDGDPRVCGDGGRWHKAIPRRS